VHRLCGKLRQKFGGKKNPPRNNFFVKGDGLEGASPLWVLVLISGIAYIMYLRVTPRQAALAPPCHRAASFCPSSLLWSISQHVSCAVNSLFACVWRSPITSFRTRKRWKQQKQKERERELERRAWASATGGVCGMTPEEAEMAREARLLKFQGGSGASGVTEAPGDGTRHAKED
jgi:hypothetical protein